MVNNLYDRCLRCNRLLKTDEARLRGYGDTCWKKVQETTSVRLFSIAKDKTSK